MCSNQILCLRKAVGPLTFRPHIPLNVNTSETGAQNSFIIFNIFMAKFLYFDKEKNCQARQPSYLQAYIPIRYKKEIKNNTLSIV
jgi:hypothetical protein